MSRMAWGRGLETVAADGALLDAWYPDLGLGEIPAPTGDTRDRTPRHDELRGVDVRAVEISIDLDAAPVSAEDLSLRLALLSNRLCRPRTVNLDNLFGLLSNVAWSNLGPIAVDQVDEVRWRMRSSGQLLTVHGLDKLPRMTDYVVPSGVR